MTTTFVFDVDAGYGEALVARLNRFRIRVKADVETAAVAGDRRAWRRRRRRHRRAGPGATRGRPGGHPRPSSSGPASTPGGRRWVSEIVPGETIPAETGVTDRAVNFKKGCYPGQELVERMDSRGAARAAPATRAHRGRGCQARRPDRPRRRRGRRPDERRRHPRPRSRPPQRRARRRAGLIGARPVSKSGLIRAQKADETVRAQMDGSRRVQAAGWREARRATTSGRVRTAASSGAWSMIVARLWREPSLSAAARSQATAVSASPRAPAARAIVAASSGCGWRA